jgi:hypothetical protein
MGVSGQCNALVALYPQYPLYRSLGGPRAGLDAENRRKILCSCWGSNPGCPVRSQTLYWLSYPGSYGRGYFDICKFLFSWLFLWAVYEAYTGKQVICTQFDCNFSWKHRAIYKNVGEWSDNLHERNISLFFSSHSYYLLWRAAYNMPLWMMQ